MGRGRRHSLGNPERESRRGSHGRASWAAARGGTEEKKGDGARETVGYWRGSEGVGRHTGAAGADAPPPRGRTSAAAAADAAAASSRRLDRQLRRLRAAARKVDAAAGAADAVAAGISERCLLQGRFYSKKHISRLAFQTEDMHEQRAGYLSGYLLYCAHSPRRVALRPALIGSRMVSATKSENPWRGGWGLSRRGAKSWWERPSVAG